jgi:hypothetical protein
MSPAPAPSSDRVAVASVSWELPLALPTSLRDLPVTRYDNASASPTLGSEITVITGFCADPPMRNPVCRLSSISRMATMASRGLSSGVPANSSLPSRMVRSWP